MLRSARSGDEAAAGLPPVLLRYCMGIVVLTVLSAMYTLTMTRLRHGAYPWGFQFLYGVDVGWDFKIFHDRFALFRRPGFWELRSYPLTYPAATGVVFGVLYKLGHPLRDYLLVCAAATVAWVGWMTRLLWAEGVPGAVAVGFAVTVVATCWPLWFLFDTGNIEGLVVIVLGLGLLAVVAQRWLVAAVLIGLAGALKIFPLVMLVLLLSRKKYREFAAGLAVAASVTLVSLAVMGPTMTEAQRQIDIGFRVMTGGYALAVTPGALDTNHSLYTVVRYGVILAHHRHLYAAAVRPAQAEVEAQVRRDVAMLLPWFRAYVVVAGLLGVVAYFGRIRRLPMLNQMLALSVCAVLLPPLSMDYTLLHLLVPFGLLCAYAVQRWKMGQAVSGLGICFVCFAFIFTAGTFFTVKYPLTCEVRALVLLGLVVVTMVFPFSWERLDGEVVRS